MYVEPDDLREPKLLQRYEAAREIVLRHGWNTTCFQIINPGIEYWFAEGNDAVAGYVNAGRYRVVAGAPVCSKGDLARVTHEFETDAAIEGMGVCYFGAEARLESVTSGSEGHSRVLLGAQPVWDPKSWARIVAEHRSIRAQLNRAKNHGITVEEWPVERARNNAELEACLRDWLELKGLPPLHFVVEPETLGRLEHRRIFVAKHGSRIVGFLVLSPIPTRNGWLTEQFPHARSAPNGTVELMMHTAISRLADEGAEYVTLGLSPLSRRAEIEPFDNPAWLRLLLAWMRKHGQRFYNFDGLDFFKSKFEPERWEPVFAIVNEPRFSRAALWAIANAFTNGHPYRVIAGGLAKAARMEAANAGRWISGR